MDTAPIKRFFNKKSSVTGLFLATFSTSALLIYAGVKMSKRWFPSWSQWKAWTLPSKASYYSAVLGTASLGIAIIGIYLKVHPVGIESPSQTKPVASDDRITEANLDSIETDLYSGNVLHNDSFGASGPGTPPLILTTEKDRERGYEQYETAHGTIRIRDDGSYLFSIDRHAPGNKDYHLNYTIQNAEGDISSALLRFSYYEDGDEIEGEQ